MSRRASFWILFAVLGIAGLLTTVRLLPEALDLVRDEITMDREAALAAADRLAATHGWRPAAEGRRAAASYGEENPGVRSFVELELGGSDRYQALVESGAYVPSRWTVRLFAPDSIAEVRVQFTPEGQPYGFETTLPDDDPGAGNLTPPAAEALAREIAADWNVDLADFELVENSTDQVASGRVDHAFVFRRTGLELGEGEVRLRVRVAGDRPAAVEHYFEVPESFQLRYQELRTANDGIALASSALFLVLFVMVGAGGGILVLARRRVLVVRPALVLGGVVGLALALNGLNTIPLAWMGYDSAVGERLFLAQLVASAFLLAALAAPLLGVLYMAAESMTRTAFPRQLQQWRFWSREVARSDPALGITLTGYLLTGVHLGYLTFFMLGTSRLEGWWSPASNVIQPDLVATYQPWLLAVATNLLAATWEESVFRAIPLAGAALLGARFGGKRLWIGGALLLQAVIFAAGHANYPQLPAYARVVELIPPALVWGLVYLRLGLFPTILAHFLYNLYLTAIPLFQMSAPGIWVDRIAVLVVAAIPLAIVVGARLRYGAAREAPTDARNGAWRPAEPAERAPAGGMSGEGPDGASGPAGTSGLDAPADGDGGDQGPAGPKPMRLPLPAGLVLPLGLLLLAGAWAVGRGPTLPPATASRADAVEAATAEMRARGFDPDRWTSFADFTTESTPAHRWVFEELGADVYDRLLGSWLAGPRWQVRFVDFQLPAEERVEEFRVAVDAGGVVVGFRHTLPEGRAGPMLEEAEARALARAYLADLVGLEPDPLGLDPSGFEEVAAEQNARPARRDWEFGYRAVDVLPDSLGEARLTVEIAGDGVVAARRVIEPPESWVREQEGRTSRVLLGALPMLLLVFGGGALLLVVGVRMWSRGELDVRLLGLVAAASFVLMAATVANGLPEITASFEPALGWPLQFWGWVFVGVLGSAVGAAALGLGAAVARSRLPRDGGRIAPPGLGVVAIGAAGLASALSNRVLADPSRPNRAFEGIGDALPSLTPLADGVLEFVAVLTALLLLGATYREARGRSGVRFAFELGVGLIAATVLATNWPDGAVAAAASTIGIVVVLHLFGWLFARAPTTAVEAAAAVTLTGLVTSVIDPGFPGQAAGAAFGAAAVLVLTWIVWRRMAEATPFRRGR